MEDLYKYENELYAKGLEYIGGVDEVGRGPLIGSVVAACVVLPKDFVLEGLTDSKKLSEKKRDEYYKIIKEKATAIGIGIIDEKIIDEVNIYEATKIAMKEAIRNTGIKLDHVLIDAMPLDIDVPTTSIIKGDAKSISIEASELLECFQWDEENFDLQHVKEELADVIIYSQDLLDKLNLDVDEIVDMKMAMNEKKYPIDKCNQ